MLPSSHRRGLGAGSGGRTIAIGLATPPFMGGLSLATRPRAELPNAEARGGGARERPEVDTGAPPNTRVTTASPRRQSRRDHTSRDGGHTAGAMRRSAARQCAQGARSEPRSLLYRRQGRGAQGGAQAACDAIGAIARRRKRRGLPQTRSRVGGSKNSSGMRTPHLGVTPKLGSSECVERVSSECAAWWHATPHIYVCVYVVRA